MKLHKDDFLKILDELANERDVDELGAFEEGKRLDTQSEEYLRDQLADRTGLDADGVAYILRLAQLETTVPNLVKLSAAAIIVATQAQGGVTAGPPGQGPSKDSDKEKAKKGKHKKPGDANEEVTFVLSLMFPFISPL